MSIRVLLLLTIFAFAARSANAQADEIVLHPDTQPEFPGGQDSLNAFLDRHIKNPVKVKKNMQARKLLMGFVVNKNGELSDARIMIPMDLESNKEAFRVVNMMPRWKPATLHGSPVRARWVVPMTFYTK